MIKRNKTQGLIAFSLVIFLSGCGQSSSQESSINSPSEVAAPSTLPTKPTSFTVVTTGDILLHERLWNQAKSDGTNDVWNFYPQLEGIADVIKSADRKSTRLNSSHSQQSRMPSSA